MLAVHDIIANREAYIQALRIKNFEASEVFNRIVSFETARKKTQQDLDKTLQESNAIAKKVGQLFKEGKREEAEVAKQDAAAYKDRSKELSDMMNSVIENQNKLLLSIPNIPHPSVPAGKSDEDNVVIKEATFMPELEATALPHWELTKKYDIIDFDLGNKITGAGFPIYKGKGARLQRALINFFLDEARDAGYIEVQPPLVVNEASGYGTGQLPDKDGQMYYIPEDDLYMIPTAEVPVTNMYRDVILGHEDFPIKHTAYSACFRREAGSYGSDVRGLNRLHQFDKVEIVVLEHPDKSYERLDEMSLYIQGLIEKLELPFRVLRLCGGDTSFTAALTFDMEVYSGAQEKWLEVSSVSNFEGYQSRRMKLRFNDESKKKHPVHTLNGSALALPRIVAALLENHQTPEGIRIPKALIPYTGFEMID